jgi:hypothetical protein
MTCEGQAPRPPAPVSISDGMLTTLRNDSFTHFPLCCTSFYVLIDQYTAEDKLRIIS